MICRLCSVNSQTLSLFTLLVSRRLLPVLFLISSPPSVWLYDSLKQAAACIYLVVEEQQTKVVRLKGFEHGADLIEQCLAGGGGLGVELHRLAVQELDENKRTALGVFAFSVGMHVASRRS